MSECDGQERVDKPPDNALTGGEHTTAEVTAIGRKAGRGLRWALFGALVTKLGSFVMSLVLVRLLVPADFGLYAVALAATAFAIHVNDMGIIAATVQWRGKVEDMVPTGATLALGFSIAWYGLFWLAAPMFAELAGSVEATPLVRLLTATILIDGITAVRVGVIQRRFQHDRLTRALMIGFLINATVAITLAASGAGAFSFVLGQLCQSVVTGVLVLRIARLPFRYGFDPAIAKRLMKFGVPLAAALGVEAVLLFSDSVIVGNVLGATLLGFYLLAFNVSSWVPGMVGTAVRYVSIPSFSRLAEQEPESLALGVRRTIPLMITLVLPIAVTMAVLAPALIHFLFGAVWVPASAALRFLAVVMIARMLTALSFDILTSVGKTHVTLWLNLSWALALIPSLLIGARLGGISGAAGAHAIVAIVIAIPLTVLALHRGGVDLRPVAPALVRPFLGALLAGLIMASLSALLHVVPLAELCLAGGAGLVAYSIVAVPRHQFSRLLNVRGLRRTGAQRP